MGAGKSQVSLSLRATDPLLTAIRPQTAKELFNLRHSELRNVVERTFGVLKRRFAILRGAPEYPLDIQVKIVYALVVIHNFLAQNRATELPEASIDAEETAGDPGTSSSRSPDIKMEKEREGIADRMWAAYTGI